MAQPRREPLDHVRRDDDRPRRHVPARALHRARHAGRSRGRTTSSASSSSRSTSRRARDKGGPATKAQENAVARMLKSNPLVEDVYVRLEGRRAPADEEAAAGARQPAAVQPAARTRSRSRRRRRSTSTRSRTSLQPAAAGRRGGRRRARRSRSRVLRFAHVIEVDLPDRDAILLVDRRRPC